MDQTADSQEELLQIPQIYSVIYFFLLMYLQRDGNYNRILPIISNNTENTLIKIYQQNRRKINKQLMQGSDLYFQMIFKIRRKQNSAS